MNGKYLHSSKCGRVATGGFHCVPLRLIRGAAYGQDGTFVTQLTPLQAQVAKWFGIHRERYGR